MTVLLKLSAGMALLLFGMQFMKTGLENVAQRRMRQALHTLTRTAAMGTLAGTIITMLVQSSTAITVMTIGLVNARVISFTQALGIVLGTNIGTCITTQIISFNLNDLALPAIGLGAIIMTWSRRKGWYYLGQSIVGFGIVFLGIGVITGSMEPLKNSSLFNTVMHSLGQSHLLALLAGITVTALIHSSSTTTGIIIALSHQGLIDLPMAIAMVLGSNIGTCITGILAAIGSSPAAQRVAWAHVLLNVVGVLIFFPLIAPFSNLLTITADSLPRQIANAHTIFNVISSLAVLPFIRQFAALLERIVPD
ncbi:Na/Pi-cotransporter II-like protein [Thermincola ferriacetica]|uniref:Na/Pi-cotransporter II-like protein n=1 Tax=Thermincola ferriacetica TaxID=281456 RepID=A0A0L6W4Q4_9FIRM|nr:Na/Pi symporter [Thermincola ferriacetica]KNZ70505.1 Na/Pi-cotransporter II-like protein [Thermincola ferriacetica]